MGRWTSLLIGVLLVLGTAVQGCQDLDYTRKDEQLKLLNTILDLAYDSELLEYELANYDPLDMKDKSLHETEFTVLNAYTFSIVPTLQLLHVSGLSSVHPDHLKAQSADLLSTTVAFDNQVSGSVTLNLHFTQQDYHWYDVCWTQLGDTVSSSCGSSSITMTVAFGAKKARFTPTLHVPMVECSSDTPDCELFTVNDLFSVLISNDFDGMWNQITTRTKSASISDISIGLDEITQLDFNIDQSGSFIDTILRKLSNFSVDVLNKKGSIYDTLLGEATKQVKALLNSIVHDKLTHRFQGSCN